MIILSRDDFWFDERGNSLPSQPKGAKSATYEQIVDGAIGIFRMAGLSDYGRIPKDELGFSQMVGIFCKILKDSNVRAETICPATYRILERSSNFPSPAELINVCRELELEMYDRVGFFVVEGEKKNVMSSIQVPKGLPDDKKNFAAKAVALKKGMVIADATDTHDLSKAVPRTPKAPQSLAARAVFQESTPEEILEAEKRLLEMKANLEKARRMK